MLLVICSPEREITKCRRSRKCSKEEGHSGKCDSKLQINPFWKTSPVYNIHKQRQSLQEGFDRLQVKEDDLCKKEEDVLALQSNTEELMKRSGMRCVLVTSIYLSYRPSIKPRTWNIPEHPGTLNNYDNYEKNM